MDTINRRREQRFALGVGSLIIACSVIFNEWTIARALSPDGEIESASFRIIIGLIDLFGVLGGGFIITHPRYAKAPATTLVLGGSFVVTSLVIFTILEHFPSLIRVLNLSGIHYYALRGAYIVDDELVLRNRPSSIFTTSQFKGELYNPSYSVEVPAMTYKAAYDKDGFRNSPFRTRSDIVVIGDSYIEFGHDNDDTFSKRLEMMSGLSSTNLGTGWHGPFQYLSVLKRYGIAQHPKYALLCFFEGNDIGDIREYMQWKSGEDYWHFNLSSKNVFQRYVMVLQDLAFSTGTLAAQFTAPGAPQDSPSHDELHPNLVVLQLGVETIKTVFLYKNETRSADELLQSQEWNVLEQLFAEFKTISHEHNIVPFVMFIPTKAHIYAEYSSASSGINWAKIRDQQISAKSNVETAMARICKEVGVKLISLTPVFERAAKRGKFLYYPFDTHWNSEARQIAAWFVGRNALDVQNRSVRTLEASVQPPQ
ncbi:MAG: alginate O-acetyltransferase AlgX-related protein [Nitrospiraceae bacterium]